MGRYNDDYGYDYWYENARDEARAEARDDAAAEALSEAVDEILDDDVRENMRALAGRLETSHDVPAACAELLVMFGGKLSDKLAERAMEIFAVSVDEENFDADIVASELADRSYWESDDVGEYVTANDVEDAAREALRDADDDEQFRRDHAPGRI